MILHTEITGDGEPLVFLHTGLQTGKTELSLQKNYFKDHYQVILPDLRGHGKSVSEDYTDYFHKTASDLAETLHDLEIEAAHIVGCSIGALVGLVFAKKYPKRVKTLTLSGIIPEKPNNYEEMTKEEMKNTKGLLENTEAVAYFDSIHEGNWKKLMKVTQKEEWYPFEETKDLSMLDMPILYIVGEKNKHEVLGTISYPEQNKAIHVSTIPFAGHTVHLEQPDIYNKIVEKFLIQSTEKVSNEK